MLKETLDVMCPATIRGANEAEFRGLSREFLWGGDAFVDCPLEFFELVDVTFEAGIHCTSKFFRELAQLDCNWHMKGVFVSLWCITCSVVTDLAMQQCFVETLVWPGKSLKELVACTIIADCKGGACKDR